MQQVAVMQFGKRHDTADTHHTIRPNGLLPAPTCCRLVTEIAVVVV